MRSDRENVFGNVVTSYEGLRRVASDAQPWHIRLPDPDSAPSWSSLVEPIEQALRKERPTKLTKWTAVEPAYAQLVHHLRDLSTAWRHPTFQAAAKYTLDEAREIVQATHDCMQHLTTARLR